MLAFVITHVDSPSPHRAALQTHTHRMAGLWTWLNITQNIRVELRTPGQAGAAFFVQPGSQSSVRLVGRNLSWMRSLNGCAWPWGWFSKYQSPLTPQQEAGGPGHRSSIGVKVSYRHLLSSLPNQQPPK